MTRTTTSAVGAGSGAAASRTQQAGRGGALVVGSDVPAVASGGRPAAGADERLAAGADGRPEISAVRWVDGFRIVRGRPLPLGATATATGINFAVASATATRMILVLLDPERGSVLGEIPFPDDYRVGDVFAMTVLGLDPDLVHYALRVDGPAHAPGARFDPDALLLDPHARLLAGGERWGERPRYRGKVLGAAGSDFDWGEDRRPRLPAADLVIYELHVRGFTRDDSAGVEAPGTYAGLREKIPYLRELGVNCVELLPVFEFDETENTHRDPTTGAPLLNSWGYSPIGFFSPKTGYAADPAEDGAARELKELVKALHAAGLEVILDVVFNHTGEGDHRGPTLSFRGIDNATYYLLTPEGYYQNYSGTGNTLNCNHPVVRSFIADCLRYWAVEYHIDGFRFDLASILSRGTDGSPMENPPLLEELAHDPVLADCRLIAEAWDAAGLYQVGSFPAYGRWMEWNGRYRDTLRRFLVGRPDSAGELAARLVGSPDLYAGRGTGASVNFVTCHDGFTLADWVSYDHKHNEANGEDGRDGGEDDASWNHGHEGPTDDPEIRALRGRQTRNALLLLLMSNGVPMLLAGDEFGRTQQGNNNAYGQDNEITWVDWAAAAGHTDLIRFVRRCIDFRLAHPVLRRAAHPQGQTPPGWQYPEVSWHGARPWEPDWSPGSSLVAMMLHEKADDGRTDTVFVAANAHAEQRIVTPPAAPAGTGWHLFADTGRAQAAAEAGEEPAWAGPELTLTARSAVVLVARPDGSEDT
ncbi:glycogen debranching protein [Actinoalloteichus sp. GBA129-24]|uniref:glycogen debranching protein n=1 Tax=Actinoalloteichus sp. GBA129-24 TaxID=1612551 RepID=UPI0009505A86|nr:isoamylase [Actinoalloteichus sp. GBA129-24]APU19535.1 pullulanase-like glycosidase [Actinoalloteichus sp. GBA129-24]